LAGFTSGEDSFGINIYKTNTKLGIAIKITFILTQHIRDEQLMRNLIEYLDCGSIYKRIKAVDFKVIKFSDNYDKIIPFLLYTLFWVTNRKIFKISVKLQA
jgi:hypothetical protein